jgi:DedD protein
MNKVRSAMDRRIKERLIGATILVVLIVLIVPELLSGPKRPALPPLSASLPLDTRNISVDLATSKATPAADAPDPAAAAAAMPAGTAAPSGGGRTGAPASSPALADGAAAHADEAPQSAPPTVTTLRAQDPSAPALETPPSSPKSPTGTPNAGAPGDADSSPPQGHHEWAVQLGSFASRINADKLAHQLKARGSPVYVISSGSGPSLRYRVRMGPLPDRGAAERAVLKLKAAGHAATIVTPAS